jgi:putative cardiolipin synthase
VAAQAGTALARAAAASRQQPQSLHAPEDTTTSGFRLLPLGRFSLDARLQLAARAEATLDVQYYHFAPDATGRRLLRALRDAAARGVRVRLLIDDLYTGGADPLFQSFAAHPGVEVRLFNPFTAARGGGPGARFAAAVGDWARVNHRMHNKLFVADGALALIGGRNIADEYYLGRMSDNFIDVDALVAGPVLPPLQALFDRYWNSDAVQRLAHIVPSTLGAAEQRAAFEAATADAAAEAPLPEQDVLGRGPVGPELDRGTLQMHWGPAYVFADHPDKPFEGSAGGELMETSVTYNVFEAIRQAHSEVMLSSPYFIPGRDGLALLRELRSRGVAVSVLTNSLASTDEPLVHLGYARYRPELLAQGVQLFELSHQRLKRNMHMFLFGASLGRLHAKSAVIDRQRVYLGSMNLDPRSATINTEIGAVIDSPALAGELMRLIEIDRVHSAYQVRLDASGRCCEWWIPDDRGMQVLREEPDATLWLRGLQWLLGPLAPEDHL